VVCGVPCAQAVLVYKPSKPSGKLWSLVIHTLQCAMQCLLGINQVNDKQKVMYKKSEKDEFSRIRMIFILLNLGA
jgi:hypothetical protein